MMLNAAPGSIGGTTQTEVKRSCCGFFSRYSMMLPCCIQEDIRQKLGANSSVLTPRKGTTFGCFSCLQMSASWQNSYMDFSRGSRQGIPTYLPKVFSYLGTCEEPQNLQTDDFRISAQAALPDILCSWKLCQTDGNKDSPRRLTANPPPPTA